MNSGIQGLIAPVSLRKRNTTMNCCKFGSRRVQDAAPMCDLGGPSLVNPTLKISACANPAVEIAAHSLKAENLQSSCFPSLAVNLEEPTLLNEALRARPRISFDAKYRWVYVVGMDRTTGGTL